MLNLLTCHGVVISDGTLTQYPSNWISKSVYVSPATGHPAPSLQAGSGLRQVIPGHQMMAQMVIKSPLFNLFLCSTSGKRLEAHRNVIRRHFGFCELTHVRMRGDCSPQHLVNVAQLPPSGLLRARVSLVHFVSLLALAFWPMLCSLPMQMSHQYGISA